MQLLDKEAMDYIRSRRGEGATYTVLEKELYDLGYRAKNGGKVFQAAVSKFACDNGLRKNVMKKSLRKIRNVATYNASEIQTVVEQLKAEGLSNPKISRKLNRLGYTTTTGLKFNPWRLRDFVRAMEATPTETVASPIRTPVTLKSTYAAPADADLHLLTELVNSNLAKASKLALIERMIK